MIPVHLEPESIRAEFPRLEEDCRFCRRPTRYWAPDKRTPVCPACAAERSLDEQPAPASPAPPNPS